MTCGPGARVDVVVVAYNSADTLEGCVAPLESEPDMRVIVVDNASPDDTAAALAGFDVDLIRAGANRGFSAGCNIGVAAGSAPYVLLLNPDARIEPGDLTALLDVLDQHPAVGIVAPRILEADGHVAFSQRRFPRRVSTFAQALFLHRVWPRAGWTDEVIRDPGVYTAGGSPEWVSGACLLTRRTLLDAIAGLDESFFLYCEDTDLCARVRDAGFDVRYEPSATAHHAGGASAPRDQLLAVLARSRVAYARKHGGSVAAVLEAVGVALGHLTHAAASAFRPDAFRGHVRALTAIVRMPVTRRNAD